MVEFDLFWPISLEFPPEVVLFPPEVGLNQLIFQNFQGFTRFVAKSFENWPFFLEKTEPETGNQLIFQIFQGFTRFVAKSFENWPQETKIGSKSREFKRFLPPKPDMKAFIAFLCDNIFKFQAKLAQIFF